MGVAGSVHFSLESIFLVTIIFPSGYKLEKNSQLARFYSMKFTCNRCVWTTVIILLKKIKNLHLEMLLLSIKINGIWWLVIKELESGSNSYTLHGHIKTYHEYKFTM